MAATARQSAVQHEAPAEALLPDAGPIDALALLTRGGDGRIALDPRGVNRYGCGPAPDAGLAPFGSSTASTISVSAFAAVERLALRLAEETEREPRAAVYRQELDRVRDKLVHLLGLADLPGLKTVLSPSGTDLHRIALQMVAAGSAAPALVILPEIHETGSGVVSALGGQVGPTAALRASIAARSLEGALLAPQVMTAPSRLPNGTLRPAHEIDEDISTIAASAARCCWC